MNLRTHRRTRQGYWKPSFREVLGRIRKAMAYRKARAALRKEYGL